MSLFVLTLKKAIPLSKQLQADYWIQHINPAGLENDFVDSANKVEQKNECASAQIDLVFVIDSSGSVGSTNFVKTKTFLVNIVDSLDISQDETRVAVIRFSSSPIVMFDLDAHSTKTAVKNAINAISYDGGGTATDTALDEARTSVFTNTTRKSAASKVTVQCGVVTVYASFNNSYPNEADYDYKTSATDHQPGKLDFMQESEFQKFVLTVLSQKRFDLNSSFCNNPSYDISIKPTGKLLRFLSNIVLYILYIQCKSNEGSRIDGNIGRCVAFSSLI
uniref:VWFA domain-containing protein n=1 Tax=Octopus bimaculoides TaxID=37653 RepID=A0A0L8G1R5_OCTBM